MPQLAIRSTRRPHGFFAAAYNARMTDPDPERVRRTTEEPAPAFERFRIIRWVVAGILVWGIFHAIGAWRFNHNPLRAVVVLACVAAFIGFWMTMLAVRQRRLSK
jgi:hypothetical protein